MSSLPSLATGEFSQTLAWALVHFLWQGTALALIGALVMRWFPSSASARYLVGTGTMAAMLAAPVVTFLVLAPPNDVVSATRPVVELAHLPVPSGVGDVPELVQSAATPEPSVLAFMLAIWLCGVLLLTVRLLGGWVVTRRLVTSARRPVTPDVQRLAREVADRLRMRGIVRVVESSAVSVPVLIGWLSPVVLLPAAALAGLAPAQLEALLAHELAHIRRHDYLVNLLQSAVETLLFYHPAVWWISGRVRAEREHCCDDVAVRVCDRLVYVSALTDLAAMAAPPRLALAATDGSLLRRVRRLLDGGDDARPAAGWIAAFAVALLVGGAAVSGISPTGIGESYMSSRAKATDTGTVQQLLPEPVADIQATAGQLAKQATNEAQGAEARAFKVLQDAERLSELEARQAAGSSAGRGGGRGQMGNDLADLFQRELDRQANRSETQQRAQGQVDELAARLRDLARRQLEQERQRQARGQLGAGGGDAQRALADELEQAARQLEQLRREAERQGQQRQDLAEAARRLQDAANAKQQAAADGAATAPQEQAARAALEQAQRLVEQNQRQRAGQTVQEALRQVEALVRQQREIAAGTQQTSREAGPTRDAQLRQLASEQDNLRQGVADLEQQLTTLVGQAQSSEQREMVRRVQELANTIRDEMLKETIDYSKNAMAAGPELSTRIENLITSDLERLRQRVAATVETQAADLREKERDLSRVRQELLEVTSRLNALAAEKARIAEASSADRRARLLEQSFVVTSPTEIIRVGDILDIRIQGESDLPRLYEVAGDAKITLPLLGAIQAAGRTARDVMGDITTLLRERRLGATQQVTVALRRQATPAR